MKFLSACLLEFTLIKFYLCCNNFDRFYALNIAHNI